MNELSGENVSQHEVLRWQHCPDEQQQAITSLVASYGLLLKESEANAAIPGSFWGDDEAGLVGSTLYVRPDTPVHSLLHESCHFICMTPARRRALHTNAGGTVLEECAVCYLQVLLAEPLGIDNEALFRDMDSWGYSFRLGSARQWFESDAEDALQWLQKHSIVTGNGHPTGKLRL